MKHAKNGKTTFLNLLGSLGYVACLVQWLWAIVLLLPSIVNSPFFQFFTSPPPATEQTVPAAAGEVPLVITIIAFVLAILVLLSAVYIMFVKFPRAVAKTGETVTHTTAAAIAPVIVQHTHLPAKQRRAVPTAIIVFMKVVLVSLPLGLLLFTKELQLPLSFDLIMVVGFILFSWSFLLFALQFLFSRFFGIDYKTVR